VKRPKANDSLAVWPADLVVPSGVLVLTGYGLEVSVWRGRLRVRDGIGHSRREAVIHRATGNLRRLVILGHTGFMTIDAIRWLADREVGVIQLDADGRVLAAFGPLGTDRPGLRRRQALALDTPVGTDIARRLIAEKVAAQAETLATLGPVVAVEDDVVEAMRQAAQRLHVAASRDDVRLAEAMAAAAYWSAWASVPVRFARRDAALVPAHWQVVGPRSSPLTGSPRLAAAPAQAILNYLYALLEGEATIAARVVGLDPGLGVLHADQLNRDSLSADLMEPVRPLVDRFVLRLLATRTFAAADFFETRQGVCRVTPPLATELAQTVSEWRAAVGRVAEDVARLLDETGRSGRPLPTPVSGRNRSRGRGRSGRQCEPGEARTSRSCQWCGGPVEPGRQTCSQECLAAVTAANHPAFVAAGIANLARRLTTGARPELSEAGRTRVGSRARETIAAAREWQRSHPWPADMTTFEREVIPELATVPLRALAEATGLSVGYCRRVKAGEVTPHPMWWDDLRSLSRTRSGPGR
jgi:CRISPR-associated endonuclease Cas1